MENVVTWAAELEEYKDLSIEQIQAAYATPGFVDAWFDCKEHFALRLFITNYDKREYDRWTRRETSVPLGQELQPALTFIQSLPDQDAVWLAVEGYSNEVISILQEAGDAWDNLDQPTGKWQIHLDLVELAQPSVEIMAEILNDQKGN